MPLFLNLQFRRQQIMFFHLCSNYVRCNKQNVNKQQPKVKVIVFFLFIYSRFVVFLAHFVVIFIFFSVSPCGLLLLLLLLVHSQTMTGLFVVCGIIFICIYLYKYIFSFSVLHFTREGNLRQFYYNVG